MTRSRHSTELSRMSKTQGHSEEFESMTATSHAVIGTIIAAKIGNPALAVPIALASHVAADMIPHWDVATNGNGKGDGKVLKNSIVDVALGFLVSYLIIQLFFPQVNLLYAFVVIVASQLPDWLMIPYYLFNSKNKFSRAVYKFQKLFDNRLDKPWGIISQAIVVSLILYIATIF